MENVMPYIIQVGELIGAAVLGGCISRIMTIRAKRKIATVDNYDYTAGHPANLTF